jgi:hypothetical protein
VSEGIVMEGKSDDHAEIEVEQMDMSGWFDGIA